MKPCRMQNQISLYLDGQLTGEALRRFEGHLRNCEGCADEVEQMRDMLRTLRALPEREVPAGLSDRLHAALAQEVKKGTVRVKRRFNPWVVAPVAAALVVFVAGGALLLSQHSVDDIKLAPDNQPMGLTGSANQSVHGAANYDDRAAVAPQPQATAAAAATEAPAAAPESSFAANSVMDSATADSATSAATSGTAEAAKAPAFGGATDAGMQNGALTAAQSNRKMIYTATLALETRQFDASLASLQDVLTHYNGYVEQDQINGIPENMTGGARSASYTLRFPIANYGSAMDDLAKLGNLLSRNESVEDISRQYVDTDARNKALTMQRDRLYDLLAKADKMEDIIALENEITRLTTEIEQMTAQLHLWDDQVAYSTVTVTIQEILTPKAVAPADPDLSARRSGAFYDTINRMRDGLDQFTVDFMGALPWIIVIVALAGIALGITWPLVRRARRRARLSNPPKEE